MAELFLTTAAKQRAVASARTELGMAENSVREFRAALMETSRTYAAMKAAGLPINQLAPVQRAGRDLCTAYERAVQRVEEARVRLASAERAMGAR